MPYTSSNVAHVNGELLTAPELNRIEANVEDAIKRRYSVQVFSNTTIALTTGTSFVVPIFFNFASNTGRVKLTATVTAIAAGATAEWDFNFTRDGVVVNGDASNGLVTQTIRVGDFETTPMTFIVTGLTPGVSYTWGVANRRRSGTGTANINRFTFLVEEF